MNRGVPAVDEEGELIRPKRSFRLKNGSGSDTEDQTPVVCKVRIEKTRIDTSDLFQHLKQKHRPDYEERQKCQQVT